MMLKIQIHKMSYADDSVVLLPLPKKSLLRFETKQDTLVIHMAGESRPWKPKQIHWQIAFILKKGVRKRDALSYLLFNTILQQVIRVTRFILKDTIFYKSVRILAYAGDIDIIKRTRSAIKEALWDLKILLEK